MSRKKAQKAQKENSFGLQNSSLFLCAFCAALWLQSIHG
jgi:hypothetical protein